MRVRDGIKDLDLFVSDATFDELVSRGFASRVKLLDDATGEEVHHIVVDGRVEDPEIEVLKTFPGVVFAAVYENSVHHRSGLRMAAIEDVRRFKLASARPKDLADVAKIDEFLER